MKILKKFNSYIKENIDADNQHPMDADMEETTTSTQNLTDETEEEEEDKYRTMLKELADALGTQITKSDKGSLCVQYEGKTINVFSEDDKYHVDKKKFESAEEVVNYLKSESSEPQIEEEEEEEEIGSYRDEDDFEDTDEDDFEDTDEDNLEDELPQHGLAPEYYEEDEEDDLLGDTLGKTSSEIRGYNFDFKRKRSIETFDDFEDTEDEDDLGLEFEDDFEESNDFEEDFESDSHSEDIEDEDDEEIRKQYQAFHLKDDKIKWPREEEAMESKITKRFKDFR